MTDQNKEAISVLNDLIETSKDGQEGFKSCAEDIKHPELKALFVKRSADCATAAAELQAQVRAHGPRLIHWVARVPDVAAASARLAALALDRGPVRAATRMTPAGELRWQITVRAKRR